MAWGDLTLISGSDAIIYVQAAGVTAAPTSANELGWVAEAGMELGQETTQKGPHINRSTISTTHAGKSVEANFTVDVSDGVDAVRALFFTSYEAQTRLKITVQLAPTTGEKHVFDQAIPSISGTFDPAEGHQYEFTLTADTYAYTAASA
jgi:hypothetical protein